MAPFQLSPCSVVKAHLWAALQKRGTNDSVAQCKAGKANSTFTCTILHVSRSKDYKSCPTRCFVQVGDPVAVMANQGYEKLAALMGRLPEYAICRSYRALGARRLLVLQAELAHLEKELFRYCKVDRDDPQKAAASTWIELRNLADAEAQYSQSKMLREIASKQNEYYALILQLKQVLDLPAPKDSELGTLREWHQHKDGGNNFLSMLERDIYYPDASSPPSNDLISLHSNGTSDPLAQSLNDSLRPLYHRIFGQHFKKPIPDEENLGQWWEYKHHTFVVLANVICAFLSALMPITSTILLYCIQSNLKRLAIITVMSVLFSFVVSTVVRARRIDVFAGSMAFAAVQVVFVSGINCV